MSNCRFTTTTVDAVALPSSLVVVSKYFDEEIDINLVDRVRSCPADQLMPLAERLSTKTVSRPPRDQSRPVAFDELLLPAAPAAAISEVPEAKTLLLYHDVVLAADPILQWAHETCDQRRLPPEQVANQLMEVLTGLIPVMPLIDSGGLALVPPVDAVESTYRPAGGGHEVPSDRGRYALGRSFDTSAVDLETLMRAEQMSVVEGIDYSDDTTSLGFLSDWQSQPETALYWTLLDDRVAPHTIRASGITSEEFGHLGFDLDTVQGVREAADHVVNEMMDWLEPSRSGIAGFADRVLSSIAPRSQHEAIVRSVLFNEYLKELQRNPHSITAAKNEWEALLRHDRGFSDNIRLDSAIELTLPSPMLFGWQELATVRRDDEIFARMREAFEIFAVEVSALRDVDGHQPSRPRLRQLGDDLLVPEVEALSKYARTSKVIRRLGGSGSTAMAKYAFTTLGAGPAAGVGSTVVSAGFRRATRSHADRADAAAAGARLLGLLTSSG